MKSRINWLGEGERNTPFFHISILVRRKRNQINAIKNGVGEWIFDDREIMNVIRKGFEDLFTTSKSFSDKRVSTPF